ncbi:hypothetical protein R1flu_004694 [Riccia fluitans]|uniref:Protein kinase domain-containing protein n=1 Tax=Riccia fluitans TaxID=41844 RepID=A0ABD1YR11_9MARC
MLGKQRDLETPEFGQDTTVSSTEEAESRSPLPADEVQLQWSPAYPWSKGILLDAGLGSFGSVYAGVDSNGSFFTVKEVPLTETDTNSAQLISQLEQEVELLRRFKHEHIVQYLGTEKTDGKLYIFLELVGKESLGSLCKKIKLTNSHVTAYTRQILEGLKYLHSQDIIHGDVKCANVFVDVQEKCKLALFGLADKIAVLDADNYRKGSVNWMAPEVVDPKQYGLSADIWSVGCSVLEMLTGSPPFGDQPLDRVLWKVGHGEAPPVPGELPDDAKDFIHKCLEVDHSQRPSATKLLEHPFLNSAVIPEACPDDS